ncbi:arylsulfatase [Microlunatus elymi]|uniref:Arylsulfatase n=1 Tax=Microlunatus elymi TaxID=2596828 RepID=A0A516PV33_9ACTN|nr:arylsulfatase [Microlunatus elymi]QDP95022.1 arylsulfatase [Microlunatus elymi]
MPDSDVRRPNVVIIFADDMGWGDLGCNGATAIPTPAMDAVADQGVRFTDAHSASSVCTPSRYALLTGRYAWRGPLKSGVLMGHGPAIIEPDRPTLASMLGSAGYACGAFGKWHLGVGWRWRDGHLDSAFGADARLGAPQELEDGAEIDYQQGFADGPTTRGFDRFFGIAASLDMAPYCFLDQDQTLGVPDQPKQVYAPGQRTGLQTPGWQDDQVDLRVTQEAVRWLRERDHDQPFFLYLTPAAPHRPCVPPEFVRGRTGIGNRADAVCLVDWMVGEIDRTLTEIGARDDTIFIVTSDNGAPTLFAEDGRLEDHLPNGPFRGQKADIWEGGHREPLLVRWPVQIDAGAVIDHPVGLVDLYATLAELCAVDPGTGGEDSRSRARLLLGRPDPDHNDEDDLLVHHTLSGRFGLRMGRWKIEFTTGSGAGFTEPKGVAFDEDHPVGQLYDLDRDPYETTDLWSQRPEVVAEGYRRLQQICRTPDSGLPFGVTLPASQGS